jgi:hypothetical protein
MVRLERFAAFALVALSAVGCKPMPTQPALSADLLKVSCPSDLGPSACMRHRYYMSATDALYAGLPTDINGRRNAVQAFDKAACEAAAKRISTWAAAHATDLKTIHDWAGPMSADEQKALRYGTGGEGHERTEIDARLFATQDLYQTCYPLKVEIATPVRASGIDSDTGYQDGVLGLTQYKSPN